MIKKHVSLLFWFVLWFAGYSQEKNEKEYRLKSTEVPAAARKFMDEHFKGSRIKWYGENSEDKRSIEAKTSKNQKQYSIDFDRNGKLEDIEVLSSFSELNPEFRNKITHYLDKEFIRYKILKVQEHWQADSASIQQLLNESARNDDTKNLYEIEVRGRDKQGINVYKILFDMDGRVMER